MSISKRTLERFKARQEDAIEKVYLEYKNLMFFIIASYVDDQNDCDDILSDAFIKAMDHAREIKDVNSVKAYLSSIAKNEALNFLKRNRFIPNSPLIETMYQEDDTNNEVLNMIEPLLTNKEAIVTYLKVCFSYTWTEIVEETGISESTARRLFEKAKDKLRKELA